MKDSIRNGFDRIQRCRICSNDNLKTCINIGAQYLSSIFPENLNYRETLSRYPLELVLCQRSDQRHCGSLQLAHNYDLRDMYVQYPYTSASNSAMKEILADVANGAEHRLKLNSGDVVLDIGCNDGTLISFFRGRGLRLLGIDPAQNVESQVDDPNFVRVKDFFTADNFGKFSNKKAKMIFSVAMFYHLHDPVRFSRDIESCLDEDGIVVIQMAYLPAMIKTNMYDNIVHEHVGYYGVQHMVWILEAGGLEVFDVETNDVYGGSFRVYAKKKSNRNLTKASRLEAILREEIQWGIFEVKTYSLFMDRISLQKKNLKQLLSLIQTEGKKVWVYGASTKGNTIMQFCEIGAQEIVAAADSNPFKFGKMLIGSDIEIRTEQELRQERPDYLLALPYSFVESFKNREQQLLAMGTQFIVPLPEVRIV